MTTSTERSMLASLSAAERQHYAELARVIRTQVSDAGGWLPFDAFMELALYAPGLGYYVAGARKFGAAGDFVTAPELTALFGEALAAQIEAVLVQLPGSSVIENGTLR